MKTKDVINTTETKRDVNDEYGRMDYLGVDMAFIYIRGKLMFTMSEVARKLYPLWPRTTLNDRVKHMKIRWHACTTKEIEKVVSVKGIVKLGVHCTLISKEDLNTFCSVYRVGAPAGTRQHVFKSTSVKETASENKADRSMKTGKQISAGSKIKRTAGIKSHSIRSNYRKQSEVKGNKSKTRVIVKGIKLDNGTSLDGHVVNNTTGKQTHVVKQARYSAQSNKIQTKTVGRPKKRKLATDTVKYEPETKEHGYIPTKRHRKIQETSSPDSDSVSYDSGISSLQLDAPTQQKPGPRRNKIGDLKPGRPLTSKIRKQLKIKETKKKYNSIMKTKQAKQTSKGRKETVIGDKRKNEVIKRGKKSKKSEGILKKRKMDKYNCSNTITKDLIMDLKHMNDKDLINSFSPLSSPMSTTTPSEDQPYLFKLMPVKPVWRVNSSFKFISNFQLPPSLVVQNGQLNPACSMICGKGRKPPSAHPIWKWKVGEPVVSNKTVISYRMKKVKCT